MHVAYPPIPGDQIYLTNRLNRENSQIIPEDTEKVFEKIQHLFWVKTQHTGDRRQPQGPTKASLTIQQPKSHSNGRNKAKMSCVHGSVQYCIESPRQRQNARK